MPDVRASPPGCGRRRYLWVATIVGCLGLGSLTVPVVVAHGQQAASGHEAGDRLAREPTAEIRALETELLERLNAARRRVGLQPLEPHETLELIARRHSVEQAARGIVSHHSQLYGLSTGRRVLISFPHVPLISENVARNGSVLLLHQALMRSEGHRNNRMDPKITHVGIGIARSSPWMLYVTEVFVRAPDTGLADPAAVYFDADPGDYEPRESPRAEIAEETLTLRGGFNDGPESFTQTGIDAFLEGNLELAEASFRSALEVNPAYGYARFNLARVLLRAGRPSEAAELLDLLLSEDPADLDARFARGTAALLMQEFAAAEAIFRQVLEERPNDAGAWYNFGLSLEYLDQLDAAENAYRRAIELDPGSLEAHAGLRRVRGGGSAAGAKA